LPDPATGTAELRYAVAMTHARRCLGWLVGLASLGACTPDGGAGTTGTEETGGAESSGGPATTSPSTATTTASGSADGTSDGSSSGAESGSDTATDTGSDTALETTGGVCAAEFPAIVTDIDATLTTTDAEFLMQLGDGNYDPAEREGAAELITAYAELGYRVLYLTARSETFMAINTGESARELTERWLLEHDFPNDPETTMVVLSPNIVLGNSAQTFKAETLMDQQAAGWRFDYAYGNAGSDIGAYADAGIALEHTFIIGPEAGNGGTVAVQGEGWVEHTAAFLPSVPAVCEG
jgi:LNS2 (Lipin/Ned1/Smp2)